MTRHASLDSLAGDVLVAWCDYLYTVSCREDRMPCGGIFLVVAISKRNVITSVL